MIGRRLADNLRAARDRAGISQAELAQRMVENGWPSFHQQTVFRIETCARRVMAEELEALAQILGVDVGALFRAPEHAREAWLILDDARQARQAREEALRQARRFASITERLADRVKAAGEAGHADLLADEIAVARRVLALTLDLDGGD